MARAAAEGGAEVLISGLPVNDYKGSKSVANCQVHGPGEFVAVTQLDGGAFISPGTGVSSNQ